MENAFGHPQNVVIFAGSSDIARAITKKLCASRARTVVLCGRNHELLLEAAREAEEYGATTTATVLFDANDPANARATVEEAFNKVDDQVDLVIMAVGQLL
jgi:short-subunit dehydrogenase